MNMISIITHFNSICKNIICNKNEHISDKWIQQVQSASYDSYRL